MRCTSGLFPRASLKPEREPMCACTHEGKSEQEHTQVLLAFEPEGYHRGLSVEEWANQEPKVGINDEPDHEGERHEQRGERDGPRGPTARVA